MAARILAPAVYGVTAAASSIAGVVSLMAEFGLGSAIVAERNLTDRQLQQLCGVAIVAGLGALLVCVVLALPSAAVLRVPELRYLLPVIGVTIALSTVNAVPGAMLRRALAFRTNALLELVKIVASALILITLAVRGAGFWSFVLGELGATVLLTGLLWHRTPLRPMRPAPGEIRRTLSVSRDLLISRLAWYAYSNADFAIVGRRLGAEALGSYSMAWTLVSLPSEKVAMLLFVVTPSMFAQVRDDLPEFRRYALLLVEGLAMLLMPAAAGIALTAPDLVPVLIGAKWRHAVPIIQALALFGVIKAIAPLAAQILVARGRAVVARRQSLIGVTVLPVAFLLASQWGAVAVALVWTLLFPLLAAHQLKEGFGEIGVPLRTVLVRLWPVLTACLGMAVVVVAQQQLTRTWSAPARLAMSVTLGAASFTLLLLALASSRMVEAWRLVRRGR